MKILYDYQIFRSQRYGGISRYFTNLIRFSSEEDTYVPVFHSRNYYYNKLSNSFDHKYESMLFEWIYNSVCKVLTYRTLRRHKIDILHPTSNDPYFLKFIKKEKVVITVHDLVRERFPEYNNRTPLFIERRRQILQNADHIIAVSEHTKEDLMSFYDMPEDRITVVYHGLPARFGKVHITLRGLPERYLLFVGDRKRNKNFDRFLEALHPILTEDRQLHLLCVGGGEFSPEEKEKIEAYAITRQVWQKTLNDDLLAAVYHDALAFVFPSIYEGFGIPILESFAMECPILLSNIPSFKEVAKEAGTYFDPYNVKTIEEQIRWLLNPANQAEVEAKVKIGKERVHNFTLENTFYHTYNVYNKVLGLPPSNLPDRLKSDEELLSELLRQQAEEMAKEQSEAKS